MDHLRDGLLSPSPNQSSDTQSLDRACRAIRQSIAQEGTEGLRGTAFFNRTWIVNTRYCKVGDGVDSLEYYLHELWYMYHQLALRTSYENETANQDSLVLDILRIQGKGPLTRPVPGNYGIDIARTVDGTLWNDLPLLVSDMTDHWLKECGAMSGFQRLNLSSFLAKLASTRVSKDRMCQVGLLLFRHALENRLETFTGDAEMDDPQKENPGRGIQDLELVHLMPSVLAWIKEAVTNLTLLSEVSWSNCPSNIGKAGPLFVDSDLGKQASGGFTPWRWMFWLKRLHEVREMAKDAKYETMVDQTTDAIDRMIHEVEDQHSEILRVYKAGGDALHQDKGLFGLRDLVKSEVPEESEAGNQAPRYDSAIV